MSASTLAKHITRMSNVLDDDEFAAAVRILTHVIDTNSPIAASRAKRLSRMDDARWEESSPEILAFFEERDGEITHKALRECRISPVAKPPKNKPPKQEPLALPFDEPKRFGKADDLVRSSARPVRPRPEQLSLKQTAYAVIKDLYRTAGRPENPAGTFLSKAFREWKEGDVYEALQHCHLRSFNEYIDNPSAWIIKYLGNGARKPFANNNGGVSLRAPVRKSNGKLATPKNLLVSEGMADEIRELNKAVGVTRLGKNRTGGNHK